MKDTARVSGVTAVTEFAVGSRGQALVLHARERQPVRVALWEPGLPGDLEELVECTVYELRGEAPTHAILRIVFRFEQGEVFI